MPVTEACPVLLVADVCPVRGTGQHLRYFAYGMPEGMSASIWMPGKRIDAVNLRGTVRNSVREANCPKIPRRCSKPWLLRSSSSPFYCDGWHGGTVEPPRPPKQCGCRKRFRRQPRALGGKGRGKTCRDRLAVPHRHSRIVIPE